MMAISTTRASRFIPACAGNTNAMWLLTHSTPVHPRVRGEHTADTNNIVVGNGSSPRARGTPAAATALNDAERFIPACAGNTNEK